MGMSPRTPGGKRSAALSSLRHAIENGTGSLNSFEKTSWNESRTMTDGDLSFSFSPNTGTVTNNGTKDTYIYARFYQAGANSGRIRFSTGFDSASNSTDAINAFGVDVEKTYSNATTSTTRLWEAIFKVSPGATVTVLFEGNNYTSYSIGFKWIKE